MNFNSLMSIFISFKNDFANEFDPISDFKRLIQSSMPCEYVLKSLQKDILPSIEEIHKKNVLIDVEISMESTKMYKDKILAYEGKTEFDKDDSSNSLKKVQELTKDCGVIFNFVYNFSGHYLERILLNLIASDMVENSSSEITVVKIDKSDMYVLGGKFSFMSSFQYFYEKDGEYFCAFIKIYNKSRIRSDSDCPILYFLVKDASRISPGPIRVLSFDEYANNSKGYVDVTDYRSYVLNEVCKRVGLKYYFEKNFTDIESNDFIKCLYFFKHMNEYEDLLKSFCDSVSIDKKMILLILSHFICMCKPGKNEDHHECSKGNIKVSSLKPCNFLLENIFPGKKLKGLKEFFVSELKSLFTFVYENHWPIVEKYQEKYLSIMNSKVLHALENLLEYMRKKVFYMINYYSIIKYKMKYKDFDEVFEFLKGKLSLGEVKLIEENLKN